MCIMSDAEMAYSAEHVQRLLQCSVCLDRFKQPKLLPCQHTFCLSPCLEGLVNHLTHMIRCPECRADHIIPRGGPSRFPNNLTIISFLDLPRLGGQRPNARVSEAARGMAPQRSNVTGQPQVVNRITNQAGLNRGGLEGAVGGEGCAACHTEGRVIRCSHCDQLLCDSCKHAHMDMVRADVNRLVNQVRRALPQVTEQINQIGRKGAQLQNRCESVKGEISEAVDKHIRELKNRERFLQDDVDTFLVSELRGLRVHQENLEVELASMASFCDSTESTLSRSQLVTDGDLVEMKHQCVEHMETLRDYENRTLRPPVPRNIQLSAESQFLSTTISNFGDLIITSGTSTVQASNSGPQVRDVPDHRPARRPGVTSRNYAQSASQSEAQSVPHRRTSHPRNTQSAQVNFTEEDLNEDETQSSLQTHGQRESRRQRSNARIAGPMRGGREFSISRFLRSHRRHHRSLGTLPSPNDSSDQTESSSERELPNRSRQIRGRAFGIQDREESGPVGIGMASSFTFPPHHSHHTAERFDLLLDTPDLEDSSEASNTNLDEVPTYMNADSSPSVYVTTPRNKYNQKGQAIVRFGERGNGERQFTWPRGVAVSPLDNHIFVSDSSNHRVQVFDNTGVYLRTFGRYGQSEGEFDCLAGITVNGLGQVIIADRYNHRIQIFDRNGTFQRSFGSEGSSDGELSYPWGVACDNMGFIYVCDKENHRIQVFQSNGAFVRKFGRMGNSSGQFDNPHYIAVSPDNKVYVSDSSNHRVQVFSIYGDFIFSFGISGTLRGQMKFPRGIAIDNQGFVVVADSGNNRVQIFRADGRYFSMFGSWGSENGQFKGLEGLAILANGNIVVSDRENHRIQVF